MGRQIVQTGLFVCLPAIRYFIRHEAPWCVVCFSSLPFQGCPMLIHELRSTVSDDKIFFVQIHLHTCRLWSTVTLYHRHSIRSSLCLPMYGVLSALPKIRCTVHIGWLIRAATRSCSGIHRSGESQSRLMHSVPVFDAVGRTCNHLRVWSSIYLS